MIYLKKHFDGDIEYISASDIFQIMNEEESKTQEVFAFLYLVEQCLNYFNSNTSTAFGNPDLARLEGKIAGYCMAKNWIIDENSEIMTIKAGNRTKFIIEKPCINKSELNNRKELRELMSEFGL